VRANSREGTSGLSEARGVRPPRDALLALSRTHAILQSTHLELTKRCNLRCYHCYVAGTSVELPVSRWLEVVDELEVEGCLHVTLTGGEVGLKHGWLQIAERVKRRRMTLRVLTNGTVFSPEDIGRLADLRPLLVGISLYGGTAVVHERVTGVPGSFDRSIASLRALRERDVRCRIACTLMPETLPGVDEIADLAEQLDCEFVADPTVVTRADGEDSVLDYRLPVAQVREYLGSDRLRARRSQSRQVGGAGRHRTGPPVYCSAGITAASIEANGDVLPCMGFRPAFGNVERASLQAAWHGSLAAAHRVRMQAPLDDCAGCRFLDYCTGRCPRQALVEAGNMSAAIPRTCELTAVGMDLRAETHGLSPGLGE
jgi:radical SAM protein with 4Fe4S-binding SPASM domain